MPSACPSTSILAALQAADPTAAGALTLVNVGANKGYAIAEVAALWRPDLGVTPASVYADLQQAFPGASTRALLGACQDGEEVVPEPRPVPAGAAAPSLTVHAVEPTPANVAALQGLAHAMGKSGDGVHILVHAGAVGPDPGARLGYNASVCSRVGREYCQMEALRPGLAPVAGWTLDSFFVEHGVSRRAHGSIFLKMDTEGYDGAILLNASTSSPTSALATVRALEFEYHRIGLWGRAPGKVSLEAVVAKLDGAGLDCYLQYGSTLIHLTGDCWVAAAYEFFAWSNVLCVRRGDVWADAAAGLAVWRGAR